MIIIINSINNYNLINTIADKITMAHLVKVIMLIISQAVASI